jgi:hypothetical protein
MKNSARQPVSRKGSKPAAGDDITVSISKKKAAGAAAGATLGAMAAGPVGALVGGVVGSLVADNTDKVKKELQSASKAVLKKAPTLHQVETAAVKAGKKAVVALKGGGAKVKAALVTPKAKGKSAASTPKHAAASPAKAAPKKAPAKPAKVLAKTKSAPPAAAKKPAARKS